MKVVLLAPLPPPTGGIAGWTERMLNADLKNGWSVEVVDEKLTGKRNTEGGGYRKNLFDETKRCTTIWKKLAILLKEESVKIVHACIPAYASSMLRELISGIITKLKGRKFVVHFRCTVPNAVKSWKDRAALKLLMSVTDYVILLNRQSEAYIKSSFPKKKCMVIPNFVSLSEINEKKEYRDNIKNILYTGRVFSEKGCSEMISVAKLFPDIDFRLVGQVFIDVSALPENVHLLGEHDKQFVINELHDADVYMFLSHFEGEGFSNALAEAMGQALPCIVTDWAANADMIEGRGGIILQKATDETVSDAIRFMDDKSIREEMGKWNLSKVKSQYTQKTITDLYVDVYEDIISK